MKQLFNYFKQRRERKLRKELSSMHGLHRADMIIRYINGDPNVLDEWKDYSKGIRITSKST